MRAVLGIDAAWTPLRASGIALAAERLDGWHLVAAEASYEGFCFRAGLLGNEYAPPPGSPRWAAMLLDSCRYLVPAEIALIAADLPLSRSPITGRRLSDNAVSKAYGAKKCGTHSPNALRPGPLSDAFRAAFEEEGYPLQVAGISPPGLIEVYPHPALIELAQATARLPYKVSRMRAYWPVLPPEERRARLFEEWRRIVSLLDQEITGVKAAFPELDFAARGGELKAVEDKLDAVICAWVAICALAGRARPFGDRLSAIWIPASTNVDPG